MTNVEPEPRALDARANLGAATGVPLKRLVRRRGRIFHEGRWVTAAWYHRHVRPDGTQQSSRSYTPKRQYKRKEPRDFFDPERIAFVRDIMKTLSEVTNEVYRDHVVRMLDELHRIKQAERDGVGTTGGVSSPNTQGVARGVAPQPTQDHDGPSAD